MWADVLSYLIEKKDIIIPIKKDSLLVIASVVNVINLVGCVSFHIMFLNLINCVIRATALERCCESTNKEASPNSNHVAKPLSEKPKVLALIFLIHFSFSLDSF